MLVPMGVQWIGRYGIGYKMDEKTHDPVVNNNFRMSCHKSTPAASYASRNFFSYVTHGFQIWVTKSFNVQNNTSQQYSKCACGEEETRTNNNAIQRFAGNNRFETAAEISKNSFKTSDTAVLAYGLNYADALAGVPLASKLGAPILLTHTDKLPDETLKEIKRLGAKNIIILGGTGVISSNVESTLKKQGLKTQRLAGKTRFETATKIANMLNNKPAEIFFVYGLNYADALSVGSVAAVRNAPIIYLKTSGEIDAKTAAYIKSVKGTVKKAYVIGDTGVISDSMMQSAANMLGLKNNDTMIRVFGKNRYETCIAVNRQFASDLNKYGICIAKGLDFPDALAGGVFAANNKVPLFLADNTLSDSQKKYLKSKYVDYIYIFGGKGAVPDNIVYETAKALK